VPLEGRSWNDLDADTNFINAVRVRTRREATPITSFFARILGWMGFPAVAQAVAYVGPAGSEKTIEIEAPIAICAQSVVEHENPDTGELEPPDPFDPSATPPTPCWEPPGSWESCIKNCSSGSMLDSGNDAGQPTSSHNTAAWINMTTEDVEGGCDQADASEMRKLVCRGDNPLPDGLDPEIEAGDHVGSTGGVQASTYKDFKKCWEGADNCSGLEEGQGPCVGGVGFPLDGNDEDSFPEWTWRLKLPVVDCPGNNVTGCPEVLGSICVELIWMTDVGTPDPSLETPYKMTRWDTDNDGNIDPDPTWDVMENGNQPVLKVTEEFPNFAKLEDFLKNSQPDPTKPTPLSKYFEPQTFSCADPLSTFIANLGTNQIPAPLSLTDPPPNLSLLFNNGTPESLAAQSKFGSETAQYAYDQSYLQTPDPKTAPYNPDNICNADQLHDAYLHRKADAAGMGRWYSLVMNYGLRTYDNKPASLEKKTMYYTPVCGKCSQGLGTGGTWFGVFAKAPVLVQ
jgi:predicted RNA-binding protein with PUA-like domain